ncbi:hypothetical protein CORC01_06262 [Colletotrichum orchidophilum]|uniref:Cupin type-1 domain-containing protein n=1 Tax=Colletotrichum orchidophilum TaxID=1209926 RepID=A0A1G4BAN6_9PEZI|nr:uncharacterized protein CORC01_06262 [Colletotrichum orchidophilum]OHE98471.1 hypothetical protein CORC01_06262 [Colletotrichum orchidophilum]
MASSMEVECYLLSPTTDAPNSPLPVIHYRNVLPEPRDEDTVTEFLTRNRWEKRFVPYDVLPFQLTLSARERGKKGTWGHIPIRHFHPNSHECYGIFSGNSTLLIGKINEGTGQEISVSTGDVIVLPAGTAHSCLESSEDYRYIGVYPKVSSVQLLAYTIHTIQGCPRWVNEMGKKPAGTFGSVIRDVGMPEQDPVYGTDGPLMRLWHRNILAKL